MFYSDYNFGLKQFTKKAVLFKKYLLNFTENGEKVKDASRNSRNWRI